MKKVFLSIVVFVGFITVINAQAQKKAIGLRFGNMGGFGAELSYQQPFKANRIEIDLGTNSLGFGVNGIYQWVKTIPDFDEGFYLYYGGGASLGLYKFNTGDSKSLNLGILGQVGLEYNFEFPLQISIDFKPCIYLFSPLTIVPDNICVSVRYKF